MMTQTQISFTIKAMAASQPLTIIILDGHSKWALGSGVVLSSPTDTLSITSLQLTDTEIQISGGTQQCDITLIIDVNTDLQFVKGTSSFPVGTTVSYATSIAPAAQLPNGPFIMTGIAEAAHATAGYKK